MATSAGAKRPASIIEWLEPEVAKEKKRRLPETCEWIAREPTFRDWRSPEGQSPVLWIHGPPGCGKTFLTQYIVDELEGDSGSHAIASHFCDRYSSPDLIIRSVLGQLLEMPRFAPEVKAKINEELEGLLQIPPDAVDMAYNLMDKLSAALKFAPAFSLIIDGIDEVPSRSLLGPDFKLLAPLIDMATSSAGKIKLLVASRTEQNLRSALGSFPDVLITEEKVEDDMERYIKAEIDQYEHLRPHQDKIALDLLVKSEGIFIWAGLSVKALGLEPTSEAALSKLQHLPISLDEVYNQTLQKTGDTLSGMEIELRAQVLRWVTTAVRPIRVTELANAISVEANSFIPDLEEKAIAVCSSLVKVENGMLKPMHFSLEDFLRSVPADNGAIDDLPLEQANLAIARTCLLYLSHPAFEEYVGIYEDVDAILNNYPFLEYATLYWVHHVSLAEKSNAGLHALITAFFEGPNAFVWLDHFLPMVLSRSVLQVPPRPSSSIRLAYLNLILKPKLSSYFGPAQMPSDNLTFDQWLITSHEAVLKVAEAESGNDGAREIQRMVELAEVYGWLPTVASIKVQPLLERALEKASNLGGGSSRSLAITCYQALADAHKRAGRYNDAKEALYSLLELADQEFQPNDLTRMFALDSLGWVNMRLGEQDESAGNLRQALDIAAAQYGSQSPMTLRSKVTLAEVLNKLGQTEEAEILCEELKAQVREHRENGTPLPRDSISQLNTLAAVHMQQKKFKEAVDTYEVVVADRTKAFGPRHRMTLWATSQLAAAKQNAGQPEQALKLLEELLPRQMEVLEDGHPDTKETQGRIGQLRILLR